MKQNILIEIKKLSKTFNDVKVIKDLSVNLKEGDKIALIGQNGAGKTTLIRCILGLYTYEGYLSVLGKTQEMTEKKF